MMKKVIEILGWYGMASIVLAYILLEFSVFSATSLVYQFLNLTGAVGILVDAFSKKDYQPGVLNVIWALVALFTIIKLLMFR